MEQGIRVIRTVISNIRQYIRWLLLGAATGTAVGLVCSAFSWCLVSAADMRARQPWLFLTLPLGGVLIVFLYRFFHYEHSQGTDSVIESIENRIDVSPKMTVTIFLSTVITIFCGGSVGRESAALQIGGSLGKSVGDLLHLNEKDQRILLMSGMSAAFSALFGTPMTASFFAMEVSSVGIMHYTALVPCICSALVARQISLLLGVETDVFRVASTVPLSLPSGLRVVLLAACCAAVSILFCLALRLLHRIMHRSFPNPYLRIAAGGLALILLTLLCRSQDYLGTGMPLIEQALEGHALPWAFLLKILFTAVTIAAGFKGGEIVPSLFIGATFGCWLAPLIGLPASLGAAVGMISVFCGVTNTPVASLLISFELFGFTDAYYFLIAVATSYMLSGYFGLYHSQRIVSAKYDPPCS